jgi:hypothetical protein
MSGADRRLVLVLGPGRSGTSALSGALAHSGFAVPEPVAPEESNPAGFYEPQWVMDFHLELLKKADVRPLDSDPDAADVVAPLLKDADVRLQLHEWLAARFAEHERLVIKDPRLVWFLDLWVEVAEDLGHEPVFVMMLRHPSEVSSSRAEYYQSRETTATAGWINVALRAEHVTRGSARALVRYPDLTADWRAVLTDLQHRLGLRLDPAPGQKPHPIDGFIDPTLRRRESGWEDTSVPETLRTLGDATFRALGELADDPSSVESMNRVDACRSAYRGLHADALDVVRHHLMREKRAAGRARRRST